MRKKLDSSIVYGTALTCFAKYGYKKTTLEDIAAVLGYDLKGKAKKIYLAAIWGQVALALAILCPLGII